MGENTKDEKFGFLSINARDKEHDFMSDEARESFERQCKWRDKENQIIATIYKSFEGLNYYQAMQIIEDLKKTIQVNSLIGKIE